MKLFLFAIAVVTAFSGCSQSSSSASGSATSSSSSSQAQSQEATLSGETGQAEVAGDKIELKSGNVYVNGASFGPVAANAIVKYTVSSNGRVLLVAGEPRSAAK